MLHMWVFKETACVTIMCCRSSQLNLKPIKSLAVLNSVLILYKIQAKENKFNECDVISVYLYRYISIVVNSLQHKYEERWTQTEIITSNHDISCCAFISFNFK